MSILGFHLEAGTMILFNTEKYFFFNVLAPRCYVLREFGIINAEVDLEALEGFFASTMYFHVCLFARYIRNFYSPDRWKI